jgi:hypothetical protein
MRFKMTNCVASLALVQSNGLGVPAACNGHENFGPGSKIWNSGVDSFGYGFRDLEWGKWPLHRVGPNGEKVNNPLQGFSLDVTAATGKPVHEVIVGKGGQPIESFMTRPIRQAGGWPVPLGKAVLGPFVFAPNDGAEFALSVMGKPCFDVVRWIQGEANFEDTAAEFAAKRTAVHDALYAAGLIGPQTVILMAGLFEGHAFYARHKSACQQIAAANPKARFVDTAGLLDVGDGVHFRGTALINLGKRLATTYLNAVG